VIDTHCHLDFHVLFDDIDNVIAKSRLAGVTRFIVPSVGSKNWHNIIKLSNDFIYPVFGIHPWLESFLPSDIDKLANIVKEHKPIAIGECGLDFYKNRDANLQKQVFAAQISLAQEYDLPLIIHSVKAVDQVWQMLKISNIRGVFHGFNGSLQQVTKILDAGFYIGVGGNITFAKANKIRELIKFVPMERILLETDSPDKGVYGADEKTPANIPLIARALGKIKNLEFSVVCDQSTMNAETLFNL